MSNAVNDALVHAGGKIVSFLPNLIAAVMVFVAFYVIAYVFNRIITNIGRRAHEDKATVLQLIASALKTTIIVVGVITALGTLGIDVTALVAGLGLTGFALGFALKDALSNLLAGILILFYHPFHCGDRIRVGDCEGVVTDISLRYITLDAGDKIFLIPNSTCFTNWIAIDKNGAKSLSPGSSGTDAG